MILILRINKIILKKKMYQKKYFFNNRTNNNLSRIKILMKNKS